MAEAEFRVALQLLLNFDGQLEQAYVVGNGGAVLAGALRHLLLRNVELAGEAVKGLGLFYWSKVFALQVLNDGQLERLLVADLADNGGNRLLAGPLRGQPAALAGDELEAALGRGQEPNRVPALV